MIPNPKDWVQKAEEELEEFLISCNCDRISINGIDVEKNHGKLFQPEVAV